MDFGETRFGVEKCKLTSKMTCCYPKVEKEYLPGMLQHRKQKRNFRWTVELGYRSASKPQRWPVANQRRKGLCSCDIAASNCNKGVLEKLWGWGREVQVNFKDYLLLAKSFDRLTAWGIAAEKATERF